MSDYIWPKFFLSPDALSINYLDLAFGYSLERMLMKFWLLNLLMLNR
ncbi:hypothetical protein SSYIS1_12200 [Serratia symbiotica]|uniref:Uncharacterized protein n=1 Tax=Serratia symbiotica TaxID=138074 RepID=A0A455VM49_9GAMM|nr:hypothetical protein SSYIS1_12200 [Serratia symbiotica]